MKMTRFNVMIEVFLIKKSQSIPTAE